MARRGGTGTRQQALRRAQEATARRDAERIRRDKEVQAALARFFQAQAAAQKVRADAEAKAEAILAAARDATHPAEAAAASAIRELDRLGERRTDIAELTGLPAGVVRGYLRGSADDQREPHAGADICE